jgi:hypothetical protein
MGDFGFGRPRGAVIQMAYVVKDIRAEIAYWTRDLKVGPWFLIEHWSGVNPTYRGAPASAKLSIAMAFSGDMMIELLQPEDNEPSLYREVIERRGYGFHHIARSCDDVEAEIAALKAQGYVEAARVGTPTGNHVAFMDGGGDQPGFLELIPFHPRMDEMFTRYWRAAQGWDGADPIRPFG